MKLKENQADHNIEALQMFLTRHHNIWDSKYNRINGWEVVHYTKILFKLFQINMWGTDFETPVNS